MANPGAVAGSFVSDDKWNYTQELSSCLSRRRAETSSKSCALCFMTCTSTLDCAHRIRIRSRVSGTSEHDPESGTESTQDPRVKAASERVSSSEWVLKINEHLASKWVIDDDRSLDPSEIRQKRYDKEYWGGDFNRMRQCQLPPSKSRPSTGSRWWWEHSADT